MVTKMNKTDYTWLFVQVPQVIAEKRPFTWKFNMIPNLKQNSNRFFFFSARHFIWSYKAVWGFFSLRKALQLTGPLNSKILIIIAHVREFPFKRATCFGVMLTEMEDIQIVLNAC